MPKTDVIYYRDGDDVPVLDWLRAQRDPKVRAKCVAYIELLEESGHELRRPTADTLRDGIYELRPTHRGIHYRILYCFVGRNVVLLSHVIVKESKVPPHDIERAMQHRERFLTNPRAHTYTPPVEE